MSKILPPFFFFCSRYLSRRTVFGLWMALVEQLPNEFNPQFLNLRFRVGRFADD